MKNFTLYSLALAAVAGGASSEKVMAASEINADGEQTQLRKNVLMIAVDDLKPLLGCYGDSLAKTPNIDRLAERGVVFTSAYCQQAVSAATRASLLTGWCPDRTRVWDLKTLIRSQNPDVVTLPQLFKEGGYTVAGIGKIYDPRSVDKQADALSWSQPFMNYEEYLNEKYEKPVMSHYQDKETRQLYYKYRKKAEEQGLQKKNLIEKYIQEYVKPTVECAPVPDNAYTDGAVADGAVKFLAKYKSDKPFFLAVGFKKPHLPFCAPEKYWKLYQRENMLLAAYRKRALNSPAFAYHNCGELQSYSDIPPLISFSDIDNVKIPDEKARELIHGYYACISYMDAQVGKVLDALKDSGELENTIIVLWGDHGWHLGDHGLWNKHTNFEHATHVPMLIIDPSARGKRRVTAPVEFLSIYPTVCDLAGMAKPANLDGESLARIVKGEKNAKVIKPYAASQYPRVGKMGYSLRDSRYRYTVWVDWRNRKLDVEKILGEELYDYEKDPNETVNVAGDPQYAAALKQMKEYWGEYKKVRIDGM